MTPGKQRLAGLLRLDTPEAGADVEDQDQSKLLPTLCPRGSSLCHRYYTAQYFMLEWSRFQARGKAVTATRGWSVNVLQLLGLFSQNNILYSIFTRALWKSNKEMVVLSWYAWLASFWSFSRLHFYILWEWKCRCVLISDKLWGRTCVSFADVVGNQSRALWNPRGAQNNDSNVATQPVLVGIWSKHTLSCVIDTQWRPRQWVKILGSTDLMF